MLPCVREHFSDNFTSQDVRNQFDIKCLATASKNSDLNTIQHVWGFMVKENLGWQTVINYGKLLKMFGKNS